MRDSGARSPFFCVHGGGGLVLNYAALARHLDAEQPFYGIQSPLLEPARRSLQSVEELAALYLEALRAVRSEGPYRLGGHSFGGVVAFEMARQLVERGDEVAFLGVMDMAPPEMLQKDRIEAALVRESARISQGQETRESKGGTSVQNRAEIAELNKLHWEALSGYRPRHYRGMITLFRAQSSHALYSRTLRSDPALGWNDFTAKKAEVHIVPGDHFSMLEEPHVRVLAERLMSCLAARQEEL